MCKIVTWLHQYFSYKVLIYFYNISIQELMNHHWHEIFHINTTSVIPDSTETPVSHKQCSMVSGLSPIVINTINGGNRKQEMLYRHSCPWDHGHISRTDWFKLKIEILWRMCALILILMTRSGHNFAHAMTAQLSWYVQNYDLTESLFSMWGQDVYLTG